MLQLRKQLLLSLLPRLKRFSLFPPTGYVWSEGNGIPGLDILHNPFQPRDYSPGVDSRALVHLYQAFMETCSASGFPRRAFLLEQPAVCLDVRTGFAVYRVDHYCTVESCPQ